MKFIPIIFSLFFISLSLSSCTDDNDGENLYPEINTAFTYTIDHLNSVVQFNNKTTGADSYKWDFGDGTTSNDVNPMHQFSSDGTYTITLTATNVINSKKTISQDITLDIGNVCNIETEQVISESDLYINFKSDPGFTSDGINYEIITNPNISNSNHSCKVAKIQRTTAHPYVNNQLILDNKIIFSDNTGFKMKVLSPNIGAKIVLKLEDSTDATINAEVQKISSLENEWEELEFFFGPENSNKFDKIVIFFDLGEENENTFFLDDLMMAPIASPTAKLELPLTFENSVLDYTFTNFGNAYSSRVNNPQKTGINNSNFVGQFEKIAGAETWAGSFLTMTDPLILNKKTFKLKVWSPIEGATVLMKLENLDDGDIFYEATTTTTVKNKWEELSFDFSGIDTSKTYQKVIVFFDFGKVGEGSIFYFDDIIQE